MTPARNARSGKGKRGKVTRKRCLMIRRQPEGDPCMTDLQWWHADEEPGARADLRLLRRQHKGTKYDLVLRVVTDTVIG